MSEKNRKLVLAVYPEAYAHHWGGHHDGEAGVTIRTNAGGAYGRIGFGETEGEAWANAALQLPPTREYGPEQYAVEYLVKGETTWRRTMAHPLDYIGLQQDLLMSQRHIAASRIVAFCESTRLLNPEELAEVDNGR